MGFKSSLAVLILVAVVAAGWWSTRPNPVEVRVQSVAQGTVEETVTNTRAGTVKACRRARISPATGGQIATLNVHKGDRVTNGQLLFELWSKDLKAQVALAEAELQTRSSRRVEACVNAAIAERDVKRLKPLFERKLVSNEDIDIARTKVKAARASCTAAGSAIDEAQQRIELARVEIERRQLRAPFAGIVAEVNGEVGEFVTPSPPGIATPPAVDLIDDGCLYVSAPIDEVDASRISVGQVARVSLDAFRGRQFAARIKRIAPYVVDFEKQARTVEIEATFEPAEVSPGLLLPGYSADVEVVLERHESVLRVPTEVLLDNDAVFVLSDGKALKRRLKIGLRNWQFTEVLEGITKGDQIIINLDAEGLHEGVEVKVRSNDDHTGSN
jgi:HlyD family secretion protein